MSKRILQGLFVALAVVASSNAMASQARQAVLGQLDTYGVLGTGGTFHGSFLVDDNFNTFFNPAYANDYKNWATIEKQNGLNTDSSAEGGVFTQMAGFTTGVYLNRGSAINGAALAGAYNPFASRANFRPVELFIAGDHGIKWGAAIGYGSFNQPADGFGRLMTGRLGAQIAGFEPFINANIGGTNVAQTTRTRTEVKGYTAGLKYKFGEWVPFVAYRRDEHDVSSPLTTPATTAERRAGRWTAGLARNMKLTETATLNYGIAYARFNVSRTGATALVPTTDVTSQWAVPINVSVEAEMTGWLIGRAGLAYDLVNRTDRKSVV